jgi:23S rRNA (pseudouridine1915-N3)-methyltransferase
MRITLLTIGKTEDKYLKEGIDKYLKRLKHYTSFQISELPELKNTKNLSEEQQKHKEAELLFKQINSTDHVVLLDEHGQEFSSVEFSGFLNKKALSSIQHLIFVTGGPYGFDPAIYDRANDKLSLSRMTFSHQMVRLFFVEQLYRAFTIMRAEPDHHS